MNYDRRIEGILDELGVSPGDTDALAGDASARRFFRVHFSRKNGGKTVVLVVFPDEGGEEEVARYGQMAEELGGAGLPVPKVERNNPQEGYMIIEDCGDELLQHAIRESDPLPLYQQAIDLIVRMQERVSPETAEINPPFDEEKFTWELDFFLTHTLEGYYGAEIGASARAAFQDFFRAICREVLSQPRTFCHRDYHSRNLLLEDGKLRIVDFQDGRLGPYTYDLVSLLEDPYAGLEDELREQLRAYYYVIRPRALKAIFSDDFKRDYDMMSLQRLLKAAGTFGYMFMEKGKRWYVEYLPAVFQAVNEILSNYPELEGLEELLKKYVSVNPGQN